MPEEAKKHFIQEIEIKNFKCFEDFKAEGFGRVNLIGGKNNVGKTAFMEAACTNIFAIDLKTFVHSLISIEYTRNYLEYINTKYPMKEFLEKSDLFYTKTNCNIVEYKISEKDGIKKYLFKINDDEVIVNAKDYSFETSRNHKVKFINSYGYTNSQLKEVYESVQKKDKENVLYKHLNEFDENILNLKIIGGDKPMFKVDTSVNSPYAHIEDPYRDISEFGDGLKQYVSIICSLYACSNGYLFIDEIDNGIHHSKLDKLWEIILTISKEQNVQVFATTHSKECIESYARVAKRLEGDGVLQEKDTKYIELFKDNDQINTMVLSRKQLDYQLKQNHEVR